MSNKDTKTSIKGNDTGHVWDEDLRELDNPPPKWWMFGLILSFIFIIGYFIYYPSAPLISSHIKGIGNYTSMKELRENTKTLQSSVKSQLLLKENALKNKPIEQIVLDSQLVNYAVHTAKELFEDNCAACHSSGGIGNDYFPTLTDSDWLWGENIKDIYQTIRLGRKGNMPARGLAGNLSDQNINDVADFIIGLASGIGGEERFNAGRQAYTKGQCMVCHGPNGYPIAPVGAANLTDSVWRFGGDDLKKSLVKTITYGVNQPNPESRKAIMPQFKAVLSDSDIKRLAVYVSQLSRRVDYVHGK